MPQSLHPNANLEVLKKQAKEILKAYKLADGSRESGARTAYSCQTLRSLHRFAGRPDSEILEADIKLTDVQYALALQYGFESWQKLKQHVESTHKRDVQQDVRVDAADPIELIQLTEVAICQRKSDCSASGTPTIPLMTFAGRRFHKGKQYQI